MTCLPLPSWPPHQLQDPCPCHAAAASSTPCCRAMRQRHFNRQYSVGQWSWNDGNGRDLCRQRRLLVVGASGRRLHSGLRRGDNGFAGSMGCRTGDMLGLGMGWYHGTFMGYWSVQHTGFPHMGKTGTTPPSPWHYFTFYPTLSYPSLSVAPHPFSPTGPEAHILQFTGYGWCGQRLFP